MKYDFLRSIADHIFDDFNADTSGNVGNVSVFGGLNNKLTGNLDYNRQLSLMQQNADIERELRDTSILSTAKQYNELGINPQALAGVGVSNTNVSTAPAQHSGSGFDSLLSAFVKLGSQAMSLNFERDKLDLMRDYYADRNAIYDYYMNSKAR